MIVKIHEREREKEVNRFESKDTREKQKQITRERNY